MIPLYSIGNDYFRALFPDEIVGTRKNSNSKNNQPHFRRRKTKPFF